MPHVVDAPSTDQRHGEGAWGPYRVTVRVPVYKRSLVGLEAGRTAAPIDPEIHSGGVRWCKAQIAIARVEVGPWMGTGLLGATDCTIVSNLG